MTVKQAFEKAYGSLPEGATCHIGTQDCAGVYICATYYTPYYQRFFTGGSKGWEMDFSGEQYGPDISDRPAESFLGIFGPEYDSAILHDHDKTAATAAENAGEGQDFARTEKE